MKYKYKKQYDVKATFIEYYVINANSKEEADNIIKSNDIDEFFDDSDIDVDFNNTLSSEIIYDENNNIIYAEDKKKV